MVTVHKTGAARVRIIGGDHLPPHVHVDTAQGEVCVDLTTGETKGDKAARRAAKEALAWIKENRAALLAVWKGVNG